MASQVFCLTSNGGLPLLVRCKGGAEPLSFSHIASLNGVHMFANSQDVELEDTVSEGLVICWKEYHNSLILIGMSSVVTSTVLREFLDSVFDAMVLSVGIDELVNLKNPERLKRELRIAYKVIDKLLENLETDDQIESKGRSINNKMSCGSLNNLVETILCQENQALQNCLENYLDMVESQFGCMTIHGRIAVATPNWWALDSREKKLLNTFISTLNENTVSCDVPIFLPYRSSSVPFRLVTIHLLAGVEISMLCGPNPSISDIEKNSLQVWRPIVEILQLSEKTYPRNFPPAINIDSNILGFMLVNIPEGKFVMSRIQPKKEPTLLSGTHRINVLKTFYKKSARVFLMSDETDNQQDAERSFGLETYWCSEYHKCHALRQGGNLICVLYAAAVPSHTMRIITKQCLKILINEKQFYW
ncbi:hypothetical protein RUM43_003659 [Polyplax serrata]|uniref:Protein fuzzy homolog n=1 Tax=Polyplax serrata TaxID=468196 RepID=A0AAN8P0E4_POLSC